MCVCVCLCNKRINVNTCVIARRNNDYQTIAMNTVISNFEVDDAPNLSLTKLKAARAYPTTLVDEGPATKKTKMPKGSDMPSSALEIEVKKQYEALMVLDPQFYCYPYKGSRGRKLSETNEHMSHRIVMMDACKELRANIEKGWAMCRP